MTDGIYPRGSAPACATWATTVPEPLDEDDNRPALDRWQAGRCAICGTGSEQLVRDHDHETALVRGLLCTRCNTLEGSSWHPAMVTYRNGANPAAILGHREVYYNAFTGYAKPQPRTTPDEMAELVKRDSARMDAFASRTLSNASASHADKVIAALISGTPMPEHPDEEPKATERGKQ